MIQHRSPEELLKFLRIQDPKEIDVNALAAVLGAEIRYRPLEGCEARIIGTKTRAIITVNSSSLRERQRFSAAHELGHWRWHRGRQLMCKQDDLESGDKCRGPLSDERVADRYAAELLMPGYLVRQILGKVKFITFDNVNAIKMAFGTSFQASAIRLVEMNLLPNLLICHGQRGRKWFVRAKDVPDHWFPARELGAASPAFDVLFGSSVGGRRETGSAEAWFDCHGADQYEVSEQTRRLPSGDILSLLTITDSGMMR